MFYGRHVCRMDPMPDDVQRSFQNLAERSEVYHTMDGPSEFHVVGSLKGWDITGRPGGDRRAYPRPFGRYDEATPAIAEAVHRGVRGSEWVLFEESSHMPHAGERERYMEVGGGRVCRAYRVERT